MFTIKEVSNLLQVTPQNIYKQQATLTEKGYLYTDEQGKKMITQDGLNYLKDRQTEYLKFKPVIKPVEQPMQAVEQPVEQPQEQNIDFKGFSTDNELLNQLLNQFKQEITTLNNQLKAVEEEKAYFKAKFEEKDNLLNEYLNQHLLPPTEEERKEKEKRGFWHKFFK